VAGEWGKGPWRRKEVDLGGLYGKKKRGKGRINKQMN